jgi:class 3 adenylate cyclase
MTRTIRAIADGDESTMERLAAPNPAFRWIGTDPEEWWTGEDFLPVMSAQMREMGDMRIDILDLEGWELGPAAWAAARIRVQIGSTETEMRLTGTFVLDSGAWTVVQWHASEGIPNEATLGFALTTTLTEILGELDLASDFAGIAGEGMLTLMFTDVEGSTAHARALGDRVFADLMTGHLKLVEGIAGSRDGRVVKAVGDGSLVVFSSARAGVAAAVEIQQRTVAEGAPYAIRIGIHAGDVILTDEDVLGFAVNKAARVAAAASGGEILVSSVVRELVGYDGSFRFGASVFAELRGIDGIHELVSVDWNDPRRPATVDGPTSESSRTTGSSASGATSG